MNNSKEIQQLKNIVTVFSMSVAAMIEAEGMKARNTMLKSQGLAPTCDEDFFLAVISRYGLYPENVARILEEEI